MKLRLEKGTKREFWVSEPGGMSLLRKCDRLSFAAAVIALAVAIAYLAYMHAASPLALKDAAPWLSAPFVACGLIYYVRSRPYLLAIPAAVAAAMWLAGLPPSLIALAIILVIGIPGVVSLVEALQRWMFYRVLGSIEYYNVKARHSHFDNMVAFVFKIPEDLDTRNIRINDEARRRRVPWGDIAGTIVLGMVVGFFVWIYISMNPAIMDMSGDVNLENILSAHFLIFSLILYIPVIVLPWSVFRSLRARVETRNRDYIIYNGVVSTIKTMAVPIVAAFLLVFSAIGSAGYLSVLYYLMLSSAMVAAIVAFSSFLYYLAFEGPLVNDILSKWKAFRPVPVFASLEGDRRPADPVPGTPRRDTEDMGSFDMPR